MELNKLLHQAMVVHQKGKLDTLSSFSRGSLDYLFLENILISR